MLKESWVPFRLFGGLHQLLVMWLISAGTGLSVAPIPLTV